MKRKRNLILCGFMGTGKSVVGEAVSRVLNYEFLDTDGCIEKSLNRSVVDIFRESGEDYFRELEKRLIRKLPGGETVIAAGGGAVIDRQNYDFLSDNGFMILLKASAERIFERIRNDNSRPLLAGESSIEDIRELLLRRQSVYDKIEYSVDTEDLDIRSVRDAVIEIYKENE